MALAITHNRFALMDTISVNAAIGFSKTYQKFQVPLKIIEVLGELLAVPSQVLANSRHPRAAKAAVAAPTPFDKPWLASAPNSIGASWEDTRRTAAQMRPAMPGRPFEMHPHTRHRPGRPCLYGLGRSTISRASRSPVGVKMADMRKSRDV